MNKTLIWFILYLLIFNVGNAQNNKMTNYKLINKGFLPNSINSKEFKPLKIFNNKDVIVVKNKQDIKILEFKNESWTILNEIQDSTSRDTKFETGNIFNNNSEQLITINERIINIYYWNKNVFNKYTYNFPYFIDDLKIGDIDQDKKNELIVFCTKEILDDNIPVGIYNVAVVSFNNETFNIKWIDNSNLNIVNSNVVPSPNIECICDIENLGYNQIIIKDSQSDVSPSKYKIYKWINNELKYIDKFIITENKVVKDGYNENIPFLIGNLKPFKLNAETVFWGKIINTNHASGGGYILKIHNGQFKLLNKVIDGCWGYEANWVDIDGTGKGILKLKKSERLVHYEFFRKQ